MKEIFVLIFFVRFLFAIDTLVVNYPFIKFEKNYITFYNYNRLSSLCNNNKKLKILQIGDSHLVSGDFSKGFLNTLQEKLCICNATLDYEDNNKIVVKKKKKYRILKKRIHNIVTLYNSNEDSCGIDYYCIASSGKTFEYFSKNSYLEQKVKQIKPNLIIISLGTNDLVANYTKEQLVKYITNIINKVQINNAEIILVTPIEAIKRRGFNNIDIVNQAIKDVVEAKNLALYDLYEVAGGEGARLKWFYSGLSRRDLIHFNHSGYYLQGILFAKAIMNSL